MITDPSRTSSSLEYPAMHAVLVVDVDCEIAKMLEDGFEPARYEIHRADGLDAARSMLATVLYSVVIVNTLFVRSEAEQWRLVRYVRSQSARTRVLFLRPLRAHASGFRDGFAGDALLPRATDPATMMRVIEQLSTQQRGA
jgi:DNA-binding response OmpR family regulator